MIGMIRKQFLVYQKFILKAKKFIKHFFIKRFKKISFKIHKNIFYLSCLFPFKS